MATTTRSITEEAYNAGDMAPTSWPVAQDALEKADSFWLATVRSDGHPHAVPLLAAGAALLPVILLRHVRPSSETLEDVSVEPAEPSVEPRVPAPIVSANSAGASD